MGDFQDETLHTILKRILLGMFSPIRSHAGRQHGGLNWDRGSENNSSLVK